MINKIKVNRPDTSVSKESNVLKILKSRNIGSGKRGGSQKISEVVSKNHSSEVP